MLSTWLQDAWVALPDGTTAGAVGVGTLAVMVWQTVHNRRQTQAAEQANVLAQAEAEAATVLAKDNARGLASVVEELHALHTRIGAQEAEIARCHAARRAEARQRSEIAERLERERQHFQDQLLGERHQRERLTDDLCALARQHHALQESVVLVAGWQRQGCSDETPPAD